METYMISFLLVIVLHSALRITHVKGQSLRLQGSSSSAVRNETFQFTCTVTGSGSLQGGLSFQTVTGRSLNALCIVNAGTCREFSTLSGYACECVSGQTRVFYMNITSVSTDDEGTWRCQYSGINSNTISLNVLYGPGITSVPTNKQVIENASPGIDCSINITSGNPQTTTSYRWTGPGGYDKDGAVLDRLVNRNQGGMYICTATNTAGLSNTAQVNVTVQYAPAITTVPTNQNVTENARPDIDCSSNITPGNPSTTRYRWTGPGGYSKDGAVLDRLVNRNQGGMYTCTATNNAGLSDTAQVNINVQYGPRITSVPTKKQVIENSSPDIDCSSNITSGNPPATRYRWTGPGGYSKDGAVLDRLVKRNQGGMYICTATNTAGLSDMAKVDIDVQYRPQRDMQKDFSPTIIRQINDTAAMMATAAANPLPHFTWWRYDSGHLENIDDATDYTVFSSDLQTVLIVRIVHSRDYGTYALRMNNSFGESILLYRLSPASSATGQSQPDRLGQGIGIGVGVSLPVVLVLVVIIVLMWRRNHEHIEKVNKDQTETIEIQSQGHSTPNQDGAYASLDEHAPQNNEYEKLDIANSDKEPVCMVEKESVYQNQGAGGVCEDNEGGKETVEQE
ncbi:B-cell receptor CD22-like [Haliotis cracherodii]|uniref:B-cell receptor CD22-like n=1 Tax=Haliotis cracherodii TaxID=6455 RepID=UPI0039EC6AE5